MPSCPFALLCIPSSPPPSMDPSYRSSCSTTISAGSSIFRLRTDEEGGRWEEGRWDLFLGEGGGMLAGCVAPSFFLPCPTFGDGDAWKKA